MKKLSLYLFLVLIWSNYGFAEYKYKTYKENPSEFREYIHGLGDGMGWSITLQEEIGPKFFCQPRDLALSIDDYVEMFETQAAKYISHYSVKEVDEFPVGLIMAYAHQNTFPCN
tara:strand:+ start:166 stop:507 length:342 start_codon:yes stop_codon:yes gene_type:complete